VNYELLVCGVEGHELVGVGAAELSSEDALFAREADGLRWHRCLRCDSWLPFGRPGEPTAARPPARHEIELPARGKELRDHVVLRVIAIDRAIHFVALSVLAVALFLFASHEVQLRRVFFRVANAVQGSSGGPTHDTNAGFLHSLTHLFTLQSTTLYAVAGAAAAYALLEGAEAVGLWLYRRWAEYLTFVATIVFLPYEVWELARSASVFKGLAFVVNLAVAVYLLFAKRLFGLRGGAEAERALRERDSGWVAIERATPYDLPA